MPTERIITRQDYADNGVMPAEWSAWIDGREDWLTGRGHSETEALENLEEQREWSLRKCAKRGTIES